MTKKTHCVHGHEYTPENTIYQITKEGYKNRKCKECHRTYQRQYMHTRNTPAREEAIKRKEELRRQRELDRLKTPRAKHLIGNNEGRFLLKIERSIGGCWNWTAGLNEKGYGQFAVVNENGERESGTRYKNKRAHVWSYEHFVGPIPDGLIVRHICHNKSCVRPEHLEVGTHKDNAQDSLEAGLHPQQKKTHCKWGHPYTEENTIRSIDSATGNPRRNCKTCKVARKRWINPRDAEYMFFEKSDKSI